MSCWNEYSFCWTVAISRMSSAEKYLEFHLPGMCEDYQGANLTLCTLSNNSVQFAMSLMYWVLPVGLNAAVVWTGLFVYVLCFSRLVLESVQGRLLVVSQHFNIVKGQMDQGFKIIFVLNRWCAGVLL